MKKFIISMLLLSGIHSFGDEGIPQHKIDQAYEAFKRKPIDPEELKKIESLSSSELFKQLLIASPSPSRWKEMRVMTMKKRQKDLMLEIRQALKEYSLDIDTIGRLASLASLVSPEFEAEIANEILQHPSSREFDVYFMGSEEFRNHFRSEPELLRSALNTMLSEERIEKNSEIHKRWEASVSKFDLFQKKGGKREPKTQPNNRQSEQAREPQKENAPFSHTEKPSSLRWLIGGFVLLVVFLFLFKTWKGKAKR